MANARQGLDGETLATVQNTLTWLIIRRFFFIQCDAGPRKDYFGWMPTNAANSL